MIGQEKLLNEWMRTYEYILLLILPDSTHNIICIGILDYRFRKIHIIYEFTIYVYTYSNDGLMVYSIMNVDETIRLKASTFTLCF